MARYLMVIADGRRLVPQFLKALFAMFYSYFLLCYPFGLFSRWHVCLIVRLIVVFVPCVSYLRQSVIVCSYRDSESVVLVGRGPTWATITHPLSQFLGAKRGDKFLLRSARLICGHFEYVWTCATVVLDIIRLANTHKYSFCFALKKTQKLSKWQDSGLVTICCWRRNPC
jgi:hypothetical protein